MQPSPIVVAGCGRIGCELARALDPADFEVWGIRRRPPADDTPIRWLAGDLADPEILKQIPANTRFLVYSATPDGFTQDAYRQTYVTRLASLLEYLESRSTPSPHVILLSSTSVYHQDNDQWVDEASPTHPQTPSGQLLLEGEQLVRHSGLPATIVRLAGIYGGNRRQMIQRVLEGRLDPGARNHYTNRIHEADVVGFLQHLMGLASAGEALAPLYLACDSEPVRIGEVLGWLDERLSPGQRRALPATTSGRQVTSKRCSNRLMLASGYQLRFPTFREGYQEMLERTGVD